MVAACQSYQLLVNCRQYMSRQKRWNRRLLSSPGLLVLTTLPAFAFTPIGIIPKAILLITLLVSMAVTSLPKRYSQDISRQRLYGIWH
jgi:hypothetical protein